MSLTLPSSYESASKNSNIKENWAFQLFNSNSYLEFDGVDDYVNLGATTTNSPIALKNDTGITICGWVKFGTIGSHKYIFRTSDNETTWGGINIAKNSSNQLFVFWGDNTGSADTDWAGIIATSNTFALDTWTFFAIVTDFATGTGDTTIYLGTDALRIQTAKTSAGNNAINNPVYPSGTATIAREILGDDTFSNMSIKNLAIYSGELNSANITAIYNSGNYKPLLYDFGNYNQSSSLKGYWELNNGEPFIQDLSGNLQNGTIIGATYKGFLPLSTTDTSIDGTFYHGVVTNTGSVRDSIDLENSKAKTSNLSVNISNFNYKGTDISTELLFGTYDYFNYSVRVYSQLNNNSAQSNCLQIYQGRLTNISHNNSSLSLEITEKKPWDFLSIPIDKSTNGIYEPVAYGNYVNTTNPNFSNNYALYPIPFIGSLNNNLYYAEQALVSSEHRTRYYDSQLDEFPTINLGSTATSIFNGLNCINVPNDMTRTFRYRPKIVENISGFSDLANAINGSASDGATAGDIVTSVGSVGGYVERVLGDSFKVKMPEIDNKATSIKVHILSTIVQSASKMTTSENPISGGGTLPKCEIGIITHGESVKVASSRQSGSNDTTNSSDIDINLTTGENDDSGSSLDTCPETISNYNSSKELDEFIVDVRYYSGTGHTGTTDNYTSTWAVTIKDIIIEVIYANDIVNEPTASYSKNSSTKYLYSGIDGLTESYSGSNNLVEYGHEMLRDILVKFAGLDTSTPDNWDELVKDRTRNTADNGDIDTWKVRWWAVNSIDLSTVIEKTMYEFSFIFKFRADGSTRVVYIKQSSELSSSQTLSSSDIKNISIKNSSFSNLLTKMDINYQKHPAGKKHLLNVESSNNESRSKYNIKRKENIKEVKLDMNVGTPATTAQTDPNSDFYSYYDNIVGSVKKLISCEVVNSAKSYSMETGDIIKFDDMPVNPFGHTWSQSGSQYYMITSLQRGIGSVKIECREVG